MKLDLDCKEASRLISRGLDADLPPGELARLRLHFVICATCRNVDEQMKFLTRAIRRMGQNDRND